MPELPEVETIKTTLQDIVGARIDKISVLNKRLRWPVPVQKLDQFIQTNRIMRIRRRSKYLIWDMDNGYSLSIHLGMSGRVGQFRPETIHELHTHILFDLDTGWQIRYRDPRRFGFLDVIRSQELLTHPRFRNLGIEPLSSELNVDYLKQSLSHSVRTVKTVLMDAGIVAGIGNIYANEILFHAGILPQRLAKTLTESEWKKTVTAVKTVIQDAITAGGTTLSDYRNAQGEPGYFQLDLCVYGRTGRPCRICGKSIKYTKLSGRSTFFCSHCQT